MSVLQFIAALKWPLFLLIVLGFVWWRTRRNPSLGQTTRQLIEARNIRMNVGGQELELTRVEEAAAIAASSDETIAAAAQRTDPQEDPDVVSIRREAIEQLMLRSIHWGWSTSRNDPRHRPEPMIIWDASGQPLITTMNSDESAARLAAMQRRLARLLRPEDGSSPGSQV
ncbi:hypothetical protein ABZ784_03335 [Streptomyces tendae]|uniref:hypothetical protein n=1 Tax=Streptomyces tendae TaxID=1932 RepID=UPI00340C8D38